MSSRKPGSGDLPHADGTKKAADGSAAGGAAPSNGSSLSTDPATQLPSLGILEEDDEFEDFEIEDWQNEGDLPVGESNAWEDNWDDDDVSDDFKNQLRAEFEKIKQGSEVNMS